MAFLHKTMDQIIERDLDDLTVFQKDPKDHDENLRKFLKTIEKYGLVMYKEKSKFNQTFINLLGHLVSHNSQIE